MTSLINGKLKRIVTTSGSKAFFILLIKAIEKKFDYELNSSVYLVVTLFNTKALHLWTTRSFANRDVKKALRSIIEVAVEFLPKELITSNSNNQSIDLENPTQIDDEETDTLNQMLRSNSTDFNSLNN